MEILLLGVFILVSYLCLRSDIKELKPTKKPDKKKYAATGPEMVYVLANPSYRAGLFKIGLTKRTISVRARELFTTGIPTPFVVCMAIETGDCKALEAFYHDMFKDNRINSRREWFELTAYDLVKIFNSAKKAGLNVVTRDTEATQRALEGSWRPSETRT